jgi:transposase, IS5 family
VPADIRYPTDLGLLNQARKQTEKIIDILYDGIDDKPSKKPVTHRVIAKKEYLKVAKKRRSTKKERRKAIKKQLEYIKKNLGQIEQLQLSGASLEWLSDQEHKMLLVVATVYQQQLSMYENNEQRIDDRIVSLTQPHIRPIVRGKAGVPVEFGAKISVSYHNGYMFIDRLSWDNFNESGDLKAQAEKFKLATGNYPESIHVDQIYRTQENRAWCKEHGIRITGVPLGRPPIIIDKEKKKQAQLDEKFRSRIEGKFGEAKRRFSLGRVMTKLSGTSQTAIAITFLVMNLSALLRQFIAFFYIYLRTDAVFVIFESRQLIKDIIDSNQILIADEFNSIDRLTIELNAIY